MDKATTPGQRISPSGRLPVGPRRQKRQKLAQLERLPIFWLPIASVINSSQKPRWKSVLLPASQARTVKYRWRCQKARPTKYSKGKRCLAGVRQQMTGQKKHYCSRLVKNHRANWWPIFGTRCKIGQRCLNWWKKSFHGRLTRRKAKLWLTVQKGQLPQNWKPEKTGD